MCACGYSACCRGDVGICRLLVNNGAPVTIDNMSGLSPLHVACLYGHSDCVAELLKVILCLFRYLGCLLTDNVAVYILKLQSQISSRYRSDTADYVLPRTSYCK